MSSFSNVAYDVAVGVAGAALATVIVGAGAWTAKSIASKVGINTPAAYAIGAVVASAALTAAAEGSPLFTGIKIAGMVLSVLGSGVAGVIAGSENLDMVSHHPARIIIPLVSTPISIIAGMGIAATAPTGGLVLGSISAYVIGWKGFDFVRFVAERLA